MVPVLLVVQIHFDLSFWAFQRVSMLTVAQYLIAVTDTPLCQLHIHGHKRQTALDDANGMFNCLWLTASQIANPRVGVISINYRNVPCNFTPMTNAGDRCVHLCCPV
jgi:hypothetical protein